jgi:hypothetical protein
VSGFRRLGQDRLLASHSGMHGGPHGQVFGAHAHAVNVNWLHGDRVWSGSGSVFDQNRCKIRFESPSDTFSRRIVGAHAVGS